MGSQVSAREVDRRIEVCMTRQAILHKPEPLNLRVIIETPASSLYVEADTDTYRYSLVFDQLCAMALDPDDSLLFLRAIAAAT
ncbi:Scr1 family TA system antitoxin-like transcriptional regulator [Streptosporangium sp. NPDC006007]|uniref:Scr1 family TA system antitoxin-like transcriptional regulator n=1 Tax=Streptosporangium sp. NPDC006007 TaxID=3154575 RepID=UPI00339FDD5F